MEPPDVTILYGSQTGNAEDMAKRIGLQAKSLNQRVLVETMDDFPLKMLPKQQLVIFVCSTTGHGQEPENMKNLYKFMRRRDLPCDCLSNLKFAVYGLGDSSYAKFNFVSKILYKRLKECGAVPVQELVLGDEQHPYGCDGIIYPELDELWLKILKQNVDKSHSKQSENSYRATLYETDEGSIPVEEFTQDFASKLNLKTATCIINQRLTTESHFQDTRFLCFQTDDDINYEPGDVCTILPANSEENVQQFIRLLNLNPNQRFKLEKVDPNYMINYLYDFIPDGLKIKDLVKYYLDIQSVPKRSFFEFLWPFSENQLERDKLREFASTEGQEDVYEYCIKTKRSILEVLIDFPNTVKNIKFEYIFDLIPPIKPRSFSIASASSAHPNKVHLIVGVVRYKTRLRRIREGLCSNYLARLEPSQNVQSATPKSRLKFFIRRTDFNLPQDNQIPIIMVGPGLGIAPFISFIEARANRCDSSSSIRNHLYFGCRFKDKDYYFRDELNQYAVDGILRLRVAFSRETPKQYVQDLLLEDAKLIQKLMKEDKAVFYVAGNSKLPEELRSLIGKLLLNEVGDSEQQSSDGDRIISQLEASNRIQYDCW